MNKLTLIAFISSVIALIVSLTALAMRVSQLSLQ